MSEKRLTERINAPLAGGRVNREAGTIGDVLICGFESANGRDYPVAVFQRDYRKYEGKAVNIDHGKDETVERRFGWFSDVRVDESGKPRGTLNCLKTHPLFNRVMEAAERNPAMFGFSHVADCTTRYEGGREIIESINEVVSIDLVANPATTKSLFEGKQPMTLTVKTLCEGLIKSPFTKANQVLALKRLAEMDGMGDAPVPAMDTPPAEVEETGHEEAIDTAFEQAGHAIWSAFVSGKLDLAEALKKIKELAKGHGNVSGGADTSADTDTTSTDTDTEPDMKESRIPLEQVIAECATHGYEPTGLDMVAIQGIASAHLRESFIKSQKAKSAKQPERPQSGVSRPATTAANKPVTEAKGDEFLKLIYG